MWHAPEGVLCPFSCRGRSSCPSCEKKRQLLWAEWLQKEVLAPVPHRHLVLTMPRLLRGIFRKRRELLLDLSQCAAEAVAEYVRRRLGPDCRPGIVVSVATAGHFVQWHPHGHLLLTDGAFSNDGAFHALENWDAEAVMRLFRERLLARLVERHAISEDLARKLVAWKHPGFSSQQAGHRVSAARELKRFGVEDPVSTEDAHSLPEPTRIVRGVGVDHVRRGDVLECLLWSTASATPTRRRNASIYRCSVPLPRRGAFGSRSRSVGRS